MIKTETITIGGKQYMHTYSTAGCYIERDGMHYADAIDPIDSGRFCARGAAFDCCHCLRRRSDPVGD